MELTLKMRDINNLYTECSSAKRPRKPLLRFPFLLSCHISQEIATCCLFVYTSGSVWSPSSCLLTFWWHSGYFWTQREKDFHITADYFVRAERFLEWKNKILFQSLCCSLCSIYQQLLEIPSCILLWFEFHRQFYHWMLTLGTWWRLGLIEILYCRH